MARPSNREKILVATEAVATELGAAHLTLEAVANKAKMSKGGLLYHFKDKDALMSALMERYVNKCVEQRVRYTKEMGGDARAMLKALMVNLWGDRPIPPRLHSALIAACATNPKLLTPAREVANHTMETFRQSFDSMNDTLMLTLAAHGLMFLDLMQFQPFSAEERKNLMEFLLKRADGLVKKPGAPDIVSEITDVFENAKR